MAAHAISCVSCLGYNEKGFRAVKQNVLSGGRVKRKKESGKKRGRRAAIWNSNPCLPVSSFSPKVSQGVSRKEIENAGYAKISLFPGQGYGSRTGSAWIVKVHSPDVL